MKRIVRARFPDDVIDAVDGEVPGAAVPVVETREVEDSRAGKIERDVLVVGKLVEEVAGVGAFVPAGAVVGAVHVRAGANPLKRPLVPLAIRIEADGNRRRLI